MVGWEKSIGIPGLVRLELGFGVGLVLGGDGDVEEGFGVVSGYSDSFTHLPSMKKKT